MKSHNTKSHVKLNYEIFKFLNPSANTKISTLKGMDLQELLILLDEMYLYLRKKLNFDKDVTFGLEIEFEHSNISKVKKQLNNTIKNNTWSCAYDDSLFEGVEIVSPILRNTEKTWNELEKVCEVAKNNGKISDNSGAHIHVGAQIFQADIDSFFNFLKMYSVYENVINRFFYGEFLNPRPSLLKYAKPISNELYSFYKKNRRTKRIKDLLVKISRSRSNAISFFDITSLYKLEKDNTIEFRTPNGTLEPVIWQNNVNLCINILKHSNSNIFNDDIVERRRHINLRNDSSLNLYNEIYLEQALELCDLIFDNNLDKIYFLRQYLKSFEMPKEEFQKAKKFVLNIE